MDKNIRVGLFYGCEMHTTNKNWEEDVWEYQSGIPENELNDKVLYVVGYLYDCWDYSGGLMGDSCGEKHTVVFVEEVPSDVMEAIETKKSAQKYIDKYQVKVLKDYENGIEK